MGAPPRDDDVSDGLRLETLAIHAGQEPEGVFGSVIVPIYQTSTYAQDDVASPRRWDYARGGNPTREALEVARGARVGGGRRGGGAPAGSRSPAGWPPRPRSC
jgi:cystathionine beta-lyase/cystathionine gamma-synthase